MRGARNRITAHVMACLSPTRGNFLHLNSPLLRARRAVQSSVSTTRIKRMKIIDQVGACEQVTVVGSCCRLGREHGLSRSFSTQAAVIRHGLRTEAELADWRR